MSDDDILRGHGTFSAVMIAPTLDGYTVVAGIEEAILNKHTVTALWITAVTIGTVIDHFHTAHGDICGMQGMDHPEG
jgi:hypothetical protein